MAVGNIDIHFDQTGGTSYFKYSFGKCKSKNNKLEFKHTDTWLNVSNDDTLINLTAGANNDPDRDTDVEIYLNNKPCGNFIVTQDGINCSCNVETFNAEGVAAFNKDAHPNAVLGSYTASTDCITNVEVINGSTMPEWLTNVNINTSDKTITGNILANTSSEARETVTINLRGTLKPSGTCDRSITVNQNGTGCKCGDSTFKITTASPIQKQSEGGNFEFSYIASDCVKSVSNPTVVYNSGGEGWISGLALASGKKVSGTVSSYSETTTRSATITIKGTLQDDTTECSSSINIEQAGIACSCDNLSIPSTIDSIPSDGMSVNDELGTYTITNNCNKASYTAILVEDEVGTQYTVELDGNSSGIVRLKTAIPKAERDDETKHFTLKFFYNGVHCDKLDIPLEQISIPCSCKSINYFVRSLKITFPLSGTGENYVDVASGNTFGCGYLSAVTTNALLEGEELNIVQVSEFEYLFKGKVLPYTGADKYRTADVRLFFKKRDQTEWDECDRIIHLEQSNNYCDCDKMRLWTRPYTSADDNLVCSEGSLQVATSQCATLSASTDVDWITVDDISYRNLTISYTKNESDAARTGYIYVTPLIDYEEGWNSGLPCETKMVKIVQDVCIPCDCDHLEPRAYYTGNGVCSEKKFNVTGKTFVDYIVMDGEGSCEGRLYTKEMEEQGIEPQVGDYRLVFCEWDSEYEHDWIDGDPYFEGDSVYVDINSPNNSSKDRTVKFMVAVQYYRKGYVEGDYFWDGGCLPYEWDCHVYLCLTQEHNLCRDCSEVSFITRREHLPCVESYDAIAYTNDGETCNITMSGYTSDENGNYLYYDWIEAYQGNPNDTTLYVRYKANPDEEGREAYIYAFLVDSDGEPYCQKVISTIQDPCSHICNCNSYYLNVQTSGYEDEFEDGSGAHVVGKIAKNTAECLDVYPKTQQSAYTDVYLNDLGDGYCEIIADIKDKSITTNVAVSIDVIVFNTEIQDRCDADTIHIIIKPKT